MTLASLKPPLKLIEVDDALEISEQTEIQPRAAVVAEPVLGASPPPSCMLYSHYRPIADSDEFDVSVI